MNALARHGIELVVQRSLRTGKAPEQPSNLQQTLMRAVLAGRRRGYGLRGRCIQCGQSLRSHRTARGEQKTCQGASQHAV